MLLLASEVGRSEGGVMEPVLLCAIGAVLLLSVGGVAAWLQFQGIVKAENRWQLAAVAGAFLAQTCGISFYCATSATHYFTGTHEIGMLAAWALTGVWMIALPLTRLPAAGLILLPVAAVLSAVSAAWVRPGLAPQTATDALFAAHVISAYVGYVLLLIAVVAAVAYLAQERTLKRRRFGSLFRKLPSLERLDRVAGRCAGAGFLFFGAALVCGAWMAQRLSPSPESLWLEPKFFAAGLFWASLGAALLCRLVWRTSGRVKARLLLVCAVAAVVTLCLRHPFLVSPETSAAPSAERNARNKAAEPLEACDDFGRADTTWMNL